MQDGPLIVQSDRTLLLEVDHAAADACRTEIAPFAELERSPEHVHTYRITPLALWNARSAGFTVQMATDALQRWSRYPVPPAILVEVTETMARYGRLVLEIDPRHGLVLRTSEVAILEEVCRAKATAAHLGTRIDPTTCIVHANERGRLKQALLKVGWPAEDRAGHVEGTPYLIMMKEPADGGVTLRDYQTRSVDAFRAAGDGVIVLPCGAGKTLVGISACAAVSAHTLILVTNTVSARQWRRDLLAATSLTDDEIGEYSGAVKEIRPITIATYQILTTKRGQLFPHLDVFSAHDWGLIIYDEVHLLPAPVFRFTADIQSRRRLGLTATLIREDGKEGDVFSLIGPKRYDVPWRDLEGQGWIAPANCTEVRVNLTEAQQMAYAVAEPEERYRIAASAPSKLDVVEQLIARHPDEQVLVIGQFIDQLDAVAARLDAPMITGKTPIRERERLYEAFRVKEIHTLVVSKVANFSIDLPEASVAIQISGTFGSRQE
jgi:DNA excision repair protein ERCC-3